MTACPHISTKFGGWETRNQVCLALLRIVQKARPVLRYTLQTNGTNPTTEKKPNISSHTNCCRLVILVGYMISNIWCLYIALKSASQSERYVHMWPCAIVELYVRTYVQLWINRIVNSLGARTQLIFNIDFFHSKQYTQLVYVFRIQVALNSTKVTPSNYPYSFINNTKYIYTCITIQLLGSCIFINTYISFISLLQPYKNTYIEVDSIIKVVKSGLKN